MILALSPGPIFTGGGGGEREIGPGSNEQGLYAHALAITNTLGNRILL